MRLNEERYLGDAVYASVDEAGQVRLRCAAPGERDTIYLDHSVQANLIAFIDELRRTFYGQS